MPPRLVDGIHLEARLYDQAQCIPVIIGATVLHGWDTRERAIVRGWSAGPSSASAGIIKIEFATDGRKGARVDLIAPQARLAALVSSTS